MQTTKTERLINQLINISMNSPKGFDLFVSYYANSKMLSVYLNINATYNYNEDDASLYRVLDQNILLSSDNADVSIENLISMIRSRLRRFNTNNNKEAA